MVTTEMLKQDNRFHIDDFNLDRLVSSNEIIRYEVSEIEVGKILMSTAGKITSLQDTVVYKYLDDHAGFTQDYQDYCSKYGARNKQRTLENYDLLIRDFSDDVYDLQKGAIVINQFNLVVDGQHRSCILLKRYGPKYKIKVVKIWIRGGGICRLADEVVFQEIRNQFIRERLLAAPV